ncbi:MAG: hypothetical protein NZ770_05855, partial [Candidatus Poseidoniaceae archaeon]|nr:hypothetical protein [Candidatus Poseidoniaceae archaeon]
DIGMPERSIGLIIDGLVGIGAGIEFQAFRESKSLLPDVKAMLRGKIDPLFPDRMDQQWALTTSIAPILIGEDEPDDMFNGLFDLFSIMTPTWVQLAWHDIENVSDMREGLFEALCEFSRYEELADKILGTTREINA